MVRGRHVRKTPWREYVVYFLVVIALLAAFFYAVFLV